MSIVQNVQKLVYIIKNFCAKLPVFNLSSKKLHKNFLLKFSQCYVNLSRRQEERNQSIGFIWLVGVVEAICSAAMVKGI